MKRLVLKTQKASETFQIGKDIGGSLLPGDVVALTGELGAGKTQLIKGLAKGAGIKYPAYISSPTFTRINEYPGKIPFYHIDLFRLNREEEAKELGLEDYFEGKGITAVEWADKIPSFLPGEMLHIHITYTGKHKRSLELTAKGKHYEELLERSLS